MQLPRFDGVSTSHFPGSAGLGVRVLVRVRVMVKVRVRLRMVRAR